MRGWECHMPEVPSGSADLFDLVVGTSAGGAISLCITTQLSGGLRNAEEIMHIIGEKLFSQ
eukprot:2715863-Pyramimonas_sp.AAC.1